MEPNTNNLFTLYFLHKATIFWMLFAINVINKLTYSAKIVRLRYNQVVYEDFFENSPNGLFL